MKKPTRTKGLVAYAEFDSNNFGSYVSYELFYRPDNSRHEIGLGHHADEVLTLSADEFQDFVESQNVEVIEAETRHCIRQRKMAKLVPVFNIDQNLKRRLQRYAKRKRVSMEHLANEVLKLALDNRSWVNLLAAIKEDLG